LCAWAEASEFKRQGLALCLCISKLRSDLLEPRRRVADLLLKAIAFLLQLEDPFAGYTSDHLASSGVSVASQRFRKSTEPDQTKQTFDAVSDLLTHVALSVR
jgi:hypothetical protein